ncbi:MAG: FAD-dependent monooxygenase, partial [Acidobacteriota bacterium]
MTERILIVGGGVGGLATAIALEKVGIRAEVLEKAPELREIGAGLMINSNGVIALRHLGLDEEVTAGGAVVREGFFRWRSGKVLFDFPVRQLEEEIGAPILGLHRAKMLEVLKGHCDPDRILTGSKVVGLRQDEHSVELELEDGRTERGAIAIGADGIWSSVRRQLIGDGAPRYAGYTSWRGVTTATGLVKDGVGGETWGPGSRFGFMHIGEGQICWFGMATLPGGGRDEADVHRSILPHFRGWPSPVEDLIRRTPAEEIVRTDIQDREPLDGWGRGRVTLLGDAAHPMTPNMGQGASQAIEDAVVLAECLQHCDDLVAGLRDYERRRLERANWFVKQSRLFGDFAQVKNPILCQLRNLMMLLSPQSGFVKNLRIALNFTIP